MIDPVAELKASLDVLSRSEIEAAWSAAEALSKALGGNIAQRCEVAAYILGHVLAEIGASSKRPHDLADVAGAVEAVSTYVAGRMAVITIDLGKADAA